jgi:hypothetical protein
LSYSLHVTSGKLIIFSFSFKYSFLAGNLQALDASPNTFSCKRAAIVASSSFLALYFPSSAKKKVSSSISLSPFTLCSKRFQYLDCASFNS